MMSGREIKVSLLLRKQDYIQNNYSIFKAALKARINVIYLSFDKTYGLIAVKYI